MTDTTTPEPTTPEPVQAKAPAEPTGYAVYDHALLRYVTGVYPTKAKAEEAVTKVKGRKYETRQV